MPWFRSPERLGERRRVVEIPDRLTFVGRVYEDELRGFESSKEEVARPGTRGCNSTRALVAVGLRQRESIANTAIRSVAGQAGLDEFYAAHRYAREQGWLVEAGKAFSTMLTPAPAGWRAAKGE